MAFEGGVLCLEGHLSHVQSFRLNSPGLGDGLIFTLGKAYRKLAGV